MKLLAFTISTLLSLSSWALTYDGDISKTKTSLTFVSKTDSKKFQLTGATPLISTYLNKLSDGDFISVDGSKDSVLGKITVNSINYVGLKSLHGTWYGDDNSGPNIQGVTAPGLASSGGVWLCEVVLTKPRLLQFSRNGPLL